MPVWLVDSFYQNTYGRAPIEPQRGLRLPGGHTRHLMPGAIVWR
jgi:hypothetical protein